MKLKFTLLIVLSLLMIAGCSPKPAPGNDQPIVDSLLASFGNAISGGDIEKVMNCIADDVLVLDMGATFSGKDSLKAHMAPLMQFYKNFRFHHGLSTVSEDLITYHGLLSLDWSMEKVPQPVRGVTTLIWQKQPDGNWKIILEKLDFGMLAKK